MKSLINKGKKWEKSDRKAAIASHKQIDSQTVSERELLWKDNYFFYC